MLRPLPPGSSPLARGLPRAIAQVICQTGDHPRSRGVYSRPSLSSPPLQGSSPLARGLPMVCPVGLLPARIIPARAGFT